jgi:hypothetical protein
MILMTKGNGGWAAVMWIGQGRRDPGLSRDVGFGRVELESAAALLPIFPARIEIDFA